MKAYDYDVITIGGGAAGLTASGFAANLGAKIMMIEAKMLGGDCTWTGCVPSKILLKAGKLAQQMRQAGKYGLMDAEPNIDFTKVMEHVHSIREDIYEEADAPENFESMGIDVVRGQASFIDDHTLEINLAEQENRVVTSRYFFICAGASPSVPPIDGLESVDYHTSESLFECKKLPKYLTIIGAGNVGTEMAQAFNRLGSEVTVIDMANRIMTNDDTDLTKMLFNQMKAEGVEYVLDAEVRKVEEQNGKKKVQLEVESQSRTITGDILLVATGREPNVEGLNLDATDITYTQKGIEVNSKCRTNKSHIYACGDVTGDYFFTHMSEHMAKVAVSNALLKIPMKVDDDHVPWCTYTDPELAHVGATEIQLKETDTSYEVYRFPYAKLDRAILESEDTGMIKVFAKKWTGKILGASIIGTHAGELISEYAVAMKNGVSLGSLSGTIHPYPSYGLGARRAADQWFMNVRPAWLLKIIKGLFGYRGTIPEMDDPDQII